MEEINKTISQVFEKNKQDDNSYLDNKRERIETEKQRDTKRTQWNRMKNPEINPHIYVN